MRTPETERILNLVKLEEYHRRGLNCNKNVQRDRLFYFVLFFPQFRITSYTMTLSEKALQEKIIVQVEDLCTVIIPLVNHVFICSKALLL